MDPRIAGIKLKLSGVKRIIPVVSGKGGVGKSLISTTLALNLNRLGYSVGLLDLDFHGASDHVILGAEIGELPEEERGVVPTEIHGVKFMSIVFYSGDNPNPLRGEEVSDALIEILAITRWDSLDYLIIDMPPGMGEQTLDLLRFIPRGEFLVVMTPSPLSLRVAGNLITLLQESRRKILGVVENMARGNVVEEFSKNRDVRYLGAVRRYDEIDSLIGDVPSLLESPFSEDVRKIAEKITGL